MISLTGGALGLALAFGGVKALVRLLPAGFPRAHDIHVSFPVLAFTFVVSLLTGILFGLAPALAGFAHRSSRGLAEGWQSLNRGTASKSVAPRAGCL